MKDYEELKRREPNNHAAISARKKQVGSVAEQIHQLSFGIEHILREIS